MFEKYALKRGSYLLLLLSLVITLSQIIATAWCNTNSEFFGYFADDQGLFHSCLFDMPGSIFFEYAAKSLTLLGFVGILSDWVKTRNTWRNSKSINLSRVLFTLSFLSLNGLLELLATGWRPKEPSFWTWLFDNFFYMLPVAIALLLVSGWTIFNKVEIYIKLKKN